MHWVIFRQFAQEWHIFDLLLLSCTPSPFWKGVYSKKKEFGTGAKYFRFQYRPPFQKWGGVQESKLDIAKTVYQIYSVS